MTASTSPMRHAAATGRRAVLLLSALGCLAATTAATTAATQAAVLAYEGFNYTPGSAIAGSNGGTGWGGAWITQANDNGTETVSTGSLVSGNAAYNAATTGNSATLNAGHRDARLLDTSITGSFAAAGYLNGSGNIGADGATLWMSFTISETSGNADGYYELVLNRDDLGDGGRIAGIGDDAAGANVNLRTAGTQTAIIARDTSVDLFVVRIDYLAGNDTVSVWANPTTGTLGTPSLQVQNSDMSFDGVSFAAFNQSNSIHLDELRFGTDQAAVLPVPEPSALALIVLGAGMAMLRRRRR